MSIAQYLVYDSTGHIIKTGLCPDDHVALQAGAEEQCLVLQSVCDPQNEYVEDGLLVPRPACPAVLTGFVLSQLPVPCELVINGQTYPCTEATATLEFTDIGTYTITVKSWPYLDKTFEVIV